MIANVLLIALGLFVGLIIGSVYFFKLAIRGIKKVKSFF